MNRELGRQAQASAARRQKSARNAIRIGTGVVVLFALFFGIAALTNDDDATSPGASPTTTVDTAATSTVAAGTTVPGVTTAPEPFVYGSTECAPLEGAATQTQAFTDSFADCINPSATYTVTVTTNFGEFTAVLDTARAPGTVNNFVNLARHRYFDDTVCHRAIPDFMVQCGDPTASGSGGPGYSFADELPQAGEYTIGSLAMANSGPDTNGSQFFVITGDQGVSLPPDYTLFGQVTDGLDTTVYDMNLAGNDDPTANGVPPKSEITIISVTVAEN